MQSSPVPQPTVLIVDDDAVDLNLLAKILQDQAYIPWPVLDGRQALAAAQAEPPELILLDVNMPELDGFEICRRLKADPALRAIPVIFITARAATADKVAAFQAGAVDYVTKPFQVDEVVARVHTHLELRQLQRRLQFQNEHLEQRVADQTAELAARTRELEALNGRLQELSRLKDTYLAMISHELRTPANGLLGIGDLLFDGYPSPDEFSQYRDIYQTSSLRLRRLIEDATLISRAGNLAAKRSQTAALAALIDDTLADRADPPPEIDLEAGLRLVAIQGDPLLLKRALDTAFGLAAAFSRPAAVLRLTGSLETGVVQIHLPVDNLTLPEAATATFFEIESPARSGSLAEPLGLAPVAAHRIFQAFGGDLRLVRDEGRAGRVEVWLRPAPSASAGLPSSR